MTGGQTVTLLFTDLVGSTALSSRLGDEQAQALRRAHDRILTQEFERAGGRVVKHTGDGFMVAFPSARQGVESAVALQQAIESQQGEGRYAELSVRVGVHTGEPVAEGDDYFGRDVNLAARIVAEAQGGQILVSETTRLLAQPNVNLALQPLGERQLKGFPEPVSLFEVRWTREEARPGHSRFVGRREERARLRERLEAAGRGHGSLVLIAGEPGVGKTRLVSELCIEAEDRGWRVLTGRSYETEGLPPYLPFTEALQHDVQECSPEQLRARLNGNAPLLAKLLPGLRQLLPDLGEPMPLDQEAERYQLFEAVRGFLFAAASSTPLLLFLDDLHWADRASLLLMRHLAPRLDEAPLLAVGTYRDFEVGDDHPLAGLLADEARHGRHGPIVLTAFGQEDARELVQAVLGSPPAPQVVEALFAASQGNAFFIEELVRHLQEQGHDLARPETSVTEWPIPDGVRHVIARRLDRLSPEANQVLAYSSVLGRNLTLPTVAAATAQTEDAVLDLLEEALAARLLQEEGERFIFAHPLVQETLYQGLSAARRRHLHLRVAEALEGLHQQRLEAHLDELAHHFLEALPSGDVNKALDYAARAGDRAVDLFAYETAAEHYERALRAHDSTNAPDGQQRCELLLALGAAHAKAGETEKSRVTQLAAAELARSIDSPQLLARAALTLAPGWGEVGAVDQTAVDHLEEALDALPEEDSSLRSRVLGRLASVLYWSDARERRILLSRAAVEMARRLGDKETLARALNARHWALLGQEHIEERLEAASEIISLALEFGDKSLAARGHHFRLIDLLGLGDIAAADVEIAAYTELAHEIRQPLYLWHVPLFGAMRSLMRGHVQEAERLAEEALAAGQRGHGQTAAQFYGVQLFALRREQGRVAELEPAIKAFVEQYPSIPAWRAGLAYVYAGTGRQEAAREEFERITNALETVPEDALWITVMALLAEVCASLRDTDRAAVLYEVLAPYARRVVVVAPGCACFGAASHFLGTLATTMRRWDEAASYFEEALVLNERLGAPPLIARTQLSYARMLLDRRGAGDRERAAALLAQALASAEEHGMPVVASDCRELLDEART